MIRFVSSRVVVLVLLTAAVGVGGIIFGNAYASSGHVEAEEEAEHGATSEEEERMSAPEEEAGAADNEEEKAEESGAAKVSWAIVLALAGAALIPLSRLDGWRKRAPHDAGEADARSTSETVSFGLLASLAALSIGAATIHCVVVSEHWKEHWSYGAFFCASAAAQFAWAIWILVAPSRQILLLGALGNAAIVAMWIVTRTVGVPLGPEAGEREAVAFADVVATGFEVALVIGALVAARVRATGRKALSAAPAAAWLAQLTVVVLTAASLLSLVGMLVG